MPEPTFSIDWFSQNIAPLTQALAKFKGQPNIHALEIGCFEGKGTLWLLNNILTGEGSSIMCIDTFQGSAEHLHFGISFETARLKFQTNINNDPRASLRIGQSSEVLRQLFNTHQFDILYVDGSHIASDVLSDMVLSWPLLKKGGVMFMDDYLWPGTDGIDIHRPAIAIDAFLHIYSEHLKLLHNGYSVAVEKL